MDAIVAAVKAYAQANYAKDGWDFIAECFTDEEIRQELVGVISKYDAIQIFRRIAKAKNEQRREAQAEAY